MMDKIYNRDVLRLAAQIGATEPLLKPDATTSVRSPLCGSTIEVSLKVSGGRVTEFGQSIQACALGQASASIVAENVIGKPQLFRSKPEHMNPRPQMQVQDVTFRETIECKTL